MILYNREIDNTIRRLEAKQTRKSKGKFLDLVNKMFG